MALLTAGITSAGINHNIVIFGSKPQCFGPHGGASQLDAGIPCDLYSALVAEGGKIQIPPDLVVKWQAIDIADVIFSLIWRRHLVHTGSRNRKSAL